MSWFTSDLHLGHRVTISMCERPFETVEVHRADRVMDDLVW